MRPRYALLGLLSGAAPALAQCTPDWAAGEPFPGVNGPIGASMLWDPDGPGPAATVLVVAGDFTQAGETLATMIAVWDGARWSTPFERPGTAPALDGPVHALALWNGQLVAAGEFLHAGGEPAARIARWDGAAWHAVGSGVNDAVYALAASQGRLYAGGLFTEADGAPAARIAAFDGATWSPLGAGVDGTVFALGVLQGSIYAGGRFASAGGNPAANIARWDGGAWSPLDAGVTVAAAYAPAEVRTLFADDGFLYVGGMFDHAGPVGALSIARYDGAAWSASGAGVYHRQCIRYSCHNHPYRCRAITRAGNLLYAVVNPTTGDDPMVYSAAPGGAWTAVGTFPAAGAGTGWPSGTINALGPDLYAGSAFGGPHAPQNLARLAGGVWRGPSGMNGRITALAPYRGSVVALGDFSEIEGQDLPGVAAWDGTGWSRLGSGPGSSTLGLVADGDRLYAGAWPGGVFEWTGSAWVELYGAGNFGGPPAVGVWNGVPIAGLAGAAFGANTEGPASAVASWDGAAWVPLGEASGVALGPCTFATLGGALYAAGRFGSAPLGRITSPGGEWAGIGSAASVATAVVAHAGAVYAAVPSDSDAAVFRVQGSALVRVGSPFDAPPVALASLDGDLYAAGPFTIVGGLPAPGVARLAGADWEPVGSPGLAGSVFALAALNGGLIAGGDFTSIAGRGFSGFAVLRCPDTPPPACLADFNADGFLDFFDYDDFVACFETGICPPGTTADFNGDGFADFFDYADFVAAFESGC